MIKVEHTRIHVAIPNGKSMYHDVLVTDAELVLVECTSIDGLFNKYLGDPLVLHDKKYGAGRKYYKPILISESEKIEVGDYVFEDISGIFGPYEEGDVVENPKKILALSEHFSPQILSKIVSGELKDGDKVLLEVEEI